LGTQIADQRGFRYLIELALDQWRDFRATSPNKNVAALKKLGYLRTFLRFCQDNGWLPGKYGRKLDSPKVTQRPTMPFAQEEMVKILAATKPGSRVRALVLLLRCSGLRIQDAVTPRRDRPINSILLLYAAKTGVPVYCALSSFVVDATEAIPPRSEYFFWTGHAKPKSVTSYRQRRLQRLFERAKIINGHAHRFRDTHAVELLLAGTPIERVAALLGHTSIKTTERHYALWTRLQQEQLEADVKRAWLTDPVAFAETKGTSGVHAKIQ
jgi:integrase